MQVYQYQFATERILEGLVFLSGIRTVMVQVRVWSHRPLHHLPGPNYIYPCLFFSISMDSVPVFVFLFFVYHLLIDENVVYCHKN